MHRAAAVCSAGRPGRPAIELHWSLVDRANLYRIDDEGVLVRAEEYRDGDVSFRALSCEDNLIYLLLHVAKHGLMNPVGLRTGQDPAWFMARGAGNRFIWFCDIDLLLRKLTSTHGNKYVGGAAKESPAIEANRGS